MNNLEDAVTEAEEAVRQAQKKLADATFARDHKEYPKWIEPHESHVDTTDGHVSVPHFDFHLGRAGKVTVKVDDAEHEAKALSPKEAV